MRTMCMGARELYRTLVPCRHLPMSTTDTKNEPVKKKRHVIIHKQARLFSDDIISLLKTYDVGILRQGLITLRSQLHFNAKDPIPDPQDERLILAKSWLEKSPNAEGLFLILQTSEKNPTLIQLCLNIFASLLGLLSTHFIYHPYGAAMLKVLLLQQNLDILNSNISDGSQDVISSALTLFNAMSSFAGGAEKRAVMDGFAWGQKTRQKLFFLRRRTKTISNEEPMDIRTLYINLILSFLTKSTPAQIKVAFLEQHKDTFLSIFKGMDQDPYHVIRYILETCWEGIWNDNKLKRTMKIALFQERTLAHLLKLYDRSDPEKDDDEHAPASVVHHFLLAITTRRGFGICFCDRGWYPKDENESMSYSQERQEDDFTERSGGKIYNKILFNILKLLKVNEDSRQQELAFKILQACPELVSGYWTNINLTLEPRLSSRWITNISILGRVVSFPIPVETFTAATSGHIDPIPPPLRPCMSNILPTVLNRAYLSKGLQSTSALVKHCTALAMTKCLIKLRRVISVFQENSFMLEENQASGQWVRRARDLQKEVERRLPDVMVIIGMVQQSQKENNHSSILLRECALRLLGLYQTLFPRLVSEVRFDTGKLLENTLELSRDHTSGRHNILQQLHVLRFLTDNDQFSGMSKMGSSHSQLYGILLLHAEAGNLVIRGAAASLSNKVLSSSILFMHDPEELSLWLQAFPRTRSSNSKVPDELTAVLGFLDDCIQRCFKTPYKYLEELPPFFNKGDTDGSHFATLPSPLLITVLEQFEAKTVAELLSPSDTLALTTFIRKLGIGLSTKSSGLDDARTIHKKLVELVSKPVISGAADLHAALQRECTLFSNIIDFIENPSSHSTHAGESIEEHNLPPFVISDSSHPCSKAYEILDWIRSNMSRLSNEDIKRLFEMILNLHPPACVEFCYYVDPTLHALKDCTRINRGLSEMLPFELCDIHLSIDSILCGDIAHLLPCFYSGRSWNKSFIRRLATTIHRLKNTSSNIRSSRASLLKFVEQIISYGAKRNMIDISSVSVAIFVESDAMRDLCCSTTLTETETLALNELVRTIINPMNTECGETISSYCVFWTNYIKDTNDPTALCKALPWIPYMDPSAVVHSLDLILQLAESKFGDHVVQSILSSLTHQLDSWHVVEQLQSRIEKLLSLSYDVVVNRLILAVLEASLPVGYNGPMARLNSDLIPAATVTFTTMTERSRKKWFQKTQDKGDSEKFDSQFLTLLEDADRNGTAISACFYKRANTRSLFKNWLKHNSPPPPLSHGHIICIYGFLDSSPFQGGLDMELLRPWSQLLIEFVFHQSGSHRLRLFCVEAIKLLFQDSTYRALCAAWLTENARLIKPDFLDSGVIELITVLKLSGDAVIESSLEPVLESVLDWISYQFASEEIMQSVRDSISLLIPVLKGHKFKASQVETSVKSAIRNHLDVPSVLDISTLLIRTTDFKPMIINRLLQSIVQHSQLYIVSDGDSLTNLLYALFHMYPSNTCQPSHVIPLLRLYRGTMSGSDCRLISIFQLYEKQTRQSIAFLFCHWSPSQISTPFQNILTAITALDSSRVFRTCFLYPKNRRLNEQLAEGSITNQELYDPLFLMAAASQVILSKDHISVPEWVQIFRTNIFSVAISALSSKDNGMRQTSLAVLAGLHQRVQDTEMIEKDQVLYILGILKNLLSREDIPSRLPTFVVLFLAHALRCIFYPSSFLYPTISRFFLQRPEFDITDVPLLYTFLFSVSDAHWAKERTWMIRYLTQTVDDGDLSDWKILRRRHTWDLIASMWQASKPDERSLRRSILEFLATTTTNHYALPSLVLRSQIVCWVEMQLRSGISAANELLAWLKIIENIVVFMDFKRAENALKGTYSDSVIRCVERVSHVLGQSRIIENCDLSMKLDIIYLASRILLRVSERESILPGRAYIVETVESLSKILFNLESSLQWPGNDTPLRDKASDTDTYVLPMPPHKAHSLFVTPSFGEAGLSTILRNCRSWAHVVIFLWRATMASATSRPALWDNLTYRCLMVHSLGIVTPNSKEATILNWVRRMVLECIVNH